MVVDRRARIGLRVLALAYLATLLLVPVAVVFYRTFEHGLGFVWDSITTPAAVHAFWLTLEIALIAVPLNTVLGVITNALRWEMEWIDDRVAGSDKLREEWREKARQRTSQSAQ